MGPTLPGAGCWEWGGGGWGGDVRPFGSIPVPILTSGPRYDDGRRSGGKILYIEKEGGMEMEGGNQRKGGNQKKEGIRGRRESGEGGNQGKEGIRGRRESEEGGNQRRRESGEGGNQGKEGIRERRESGE